MKKQLYTLLGIGLLVLSSCGGNSSSVEEPLSSVSSEEEWVDSTADPEVTVVNKSNLKYIESLDVYKKTDWHEKARWIYASVNAADMYVALRKEFTLSENPGIVKAHIAASDKYYLWVNGILTVYDGSVKRGPTPYDGFVDEVNIPHLKAGHNTIAFLVIYNGRSSDSSIDSGYGGLLFEMKTTEKTIVSDTSFKAKRLREYKNLSLLKSEYPNYPQGSYLGERNIYFDARESTGDWMAEYFDDTLWEQATKWALPGSEPFNDTYLNPSPIIQFGELKSFLNSSLYNEMYFQHNTTIVLEVGENKHFSPYFDITSTIPGSKMIYYTNHYEVGVGKEAYSFKDTYITKTGRQTYESYPWRNGEVLIVEVPAGTTIHQISYRLSGYDSERKGSFISSDEALNILWQKAANTLEVTMRDTYMDCPDRERAPYMGDATNQVEEAFYALDQNASLLTKKAILTQIGWTKLDGAIPSRAPSVKPQEIPAQSLAFITAVYKYYLDSGDEQTMRQYYEVAMNYLRLWEMGPNGLPKLRTGSWTWYDWGSNIDSEILLCTWYYYAASLMHQLSVQWSHSDDITFLEARLQSIRIHFDSVYWTSNGYRSSSFSGATPDERVNAMAALVGLAEQSKYETIKNLMLTVYNASPFMEKNVLEALCVMGFYEEAKMRMLDRYAAMISSSDTTLWELWLRDEGSINHGWSGGPLIIMSKYFAGIKSTTSGYETYEIKPQNILSSITATKDTSRGTISFDLVKNNGLTTITIQTIDASGTLKIPASFGSNISVDGGDYIDLGWVDGEYQIVFNQAHQYTVTIA